MKKLWIVILIAAVVIAVWWMKNDGSMQYGLTGSSASPTTTATTKSATKATAKKVAPTSAPYGLDKSYSQLVIEFGANRIEFDEYCHVRPEVIRVKTGTRVMFDNRSKDAKTVTLDNRNYTLTGYGWQIVTLASSNLPQDYYVGCNKSLQAGRIMLEANISGQ